jgi:hypothetical protein
MVIYKSWAEPLDKAGDKAGRWKGEIGDGDVTGHEREGLSISLTPLMLCTLHAGGRQGRRTCGKADRCTSICTMYVKKYEFVSLSQLADCTRLRGTDCAWAAGIVIILSR